MSQPASTELSTLTEVAVATPETACHGAAHEAAERTRERLSRLPPEVGAVLISAGVVGFILPGPIGTPLVLAGGLVLIPSAFGRLERWVQRRFPVMHEYGMAQVDRFVDDFEKRYPLEYRSRESR